MNLAMSAHGNSTVFHLSGLKHACTCYTCFIRELVKKEGTRALFRGVWYNTAMAMVRSSMLFPLYELCLRYSTELLTRNNYQGLIGYTPAFAGLLSKFLSLSVTFPLEYMAVLSQAKLTENKKHLTHGFGYTMYRELIYSSCFWSIQDWLYKSLKSSDLADRTAYITSSFVSSMVSALVSYPFDLFKTWKISHPERMKERNPFRIASDIAKARGLGPLIGGRRSLNLRHHSSSRESWDGKLHLLLSVHKVRRNLLKAKPAVTPHYYHLTTTSTTGSTALDRPVECGRCTHTQEGGEDTTHPFPVSCGPVRCSVSRITSASRGDTQLYNRF